MARLAPRVYLNGRRLDDYLAAPAPVLAPLTITWGSDTAEDQPAAANAKVMFLFKESMDDIPDLMKGAELEIIDPVSHHTVLAGTVTTMSASASTRFDGGLEVTANVADYMAQLESEYVQVDWPQETTRGGRLWTEFAAAGWSLQVKADDRLTAATKLNSIKLLTLLERYISRFRGRRYDTSYRHTETGQVVREVSVFKGSTRALAPDTLIATPEGWDRTIHAPEIDGVASPIIVVPSSNILRDPDWTSTPDDAVTAVKLSTVVAGDDGFSTTEDHNFRAPAATVRKLGLRSIDVESDLAEPADWQPAAAAFFNDDAPWKPSALTIRDSDELPESVMEALLSVRTRYQALAVIEDIMPNRPNPGTSDLRSYIVGGEYIWSEKQRWEITLTMERPILQLDGEGDWWTFERVAASSDTLISDATGETVGDKLTAADFRFIGAP